MPRKLVKKLVARSVKGVGTKSPKDKRTRRVFTEVFRCEAVAMLLDGHSASSVAGRLGWRVRTTCLAESLLQSL